MWAAMNTLFAPCKHCATRSNVASSSMLNFWRLAVRGRFRRAAAEGDLRPRVLRPMQNGFPAQNAAAIAVRAHAANNPARVRALAASRSLLQMLIAAAHKSARA